MKTLRPHQELAIKKLKLSLGQACVDVGGELWRPITGAGRYWVSDLGAVVSTIRGGRFLNQTVSNAGYFYVSLMFGGESTGRKITVHKLVAQEFLGCGESHQVINHKNGIKSDNRSTNLEWCTYGENNDHARDAGLVGNFGSKHYAAKLTESDIPEIKKLVADGAYHRQVAEIYGVNRQTITKIVNEKAWRRA